MCDYISIDEFPDSVEDYKWLKEHTSPITEKCQLLFEKYFHENKIPIDEMPDYFGIPLQCHILHNHRLRYAVVRDGEIDFLCILKIVGMPWQKVYFLLSYPILPSKMGVPTDKIKRCLCKVGVEQELVLDGSAVWNHNFYNTKEEAQKMNSSKWRSKHGINKMKEIVRVETDTSEHLDGIKNLLKRWGELKGHGWKEQFSIAKEPPSQFLQHRVYLVDDTVIGYSLIVKFCGQYFVAICKNGGQSKIIEDKFVCDHIGDFMIYDLHKMMLDDDSSTAIYYFGTNTGSKKDDVLLENYKRKVFKRTIPYSKKQINGDMI